MDSDMTPVTLRPLRPDPTPLWEAAQRSCDRSQQLILECRALLGQHLAAMASLRAALAPMARPPAAQGRPSAGVDQLAEEVVLGPLTLLPLQRAIAGASVQVQLTPAEWQLLIALLMNRSSTLSRPGLAVAAWGAGFVGRHGEVEVYVSRLRRKLARSDAGVAIQTVRGQGYRLVVDEDDGAVGPPVAG
jgi:DNA-binding response OmpR family regulator